MSASNPTSAVILPFVRPSRVDNRMTFRDRMAAMEWQSSAIALGYTRVAFDTSTGVREPELGDFILIYTPETQWATWGVGCCDGGFIVWRPGDGVTISWHPTISRALANIPATLSA